MKIGLVCPYSVAHAGGVLEQLYAIQAELMRRGHEAYIVTPQPRSFTIDARKHIIFIGASTDFRSPMGTTGQISASADVDAIDEMLEREQFDILHFHEPGVPMLSRQILARSNAVNIGTFHAAFPETLTGRTFTKVTAPYTQSIIKYLDELTTVSEASAQYVSKLTERPIAIIPNGIDMRYFKPPKAGSEKPEGQKMILYVGRFEARKGVKYLLRAFKVLTQQDQKVRLLLIGDGTDRRKLEQLAFDLAIPPQQYHFAGYVENDEKLKALQGADVFCSPALYGESFGTVLTEAMACNVPIVAGNNPGYATVLTGVGSISLVNPKDTVDFARRLHAMLHEEDLRRVWQKWAKGSIGQYDFRTIVDEYEKLYTKALQKRAAA